MPRPTARERINAALRYGITLRPSGEMKWTAHVDTYTVRKQDSQSFNLIGFDADSEADAARFAAEASAKRLYGEQGVASFIHINDAPLYRASIGYYHNGVTMGSTISILILRYTHPVTGK